MTAAAGPARLLLFVPGSGMFGQEGAFHTLGRTLRGAGHEVAFLVNGNTFAENLVAPALAADGFAVHPLPLGSIWSGRMLLRHAHARRTNLAGLRRTPAALRRILAAGRYDAVVAGNLSLALYLLPALARAPTALVWRHGDAPLSSSPLARAISRAVLARADLHVANCDFLARKARPFAGGKGVRIIRNSPLGLAARPPDLAAAPARSVVYIGQLAQHKGVALLLDAFDLAAAQNPALTLTLAGAVPVADAAGAAIARRIEEARARWGGRVAAPGHVGDVAALLGADAIHVCPSIWDDPAPNVILEAKARAVPTVAFRRGGISELVRDGVDGLLVPETAEALAAAILRFAGDPALHAAARRAARQHLDEAFAPGRFRADWLGVVEEAARTTRQRTAA